jgi:hypothetical protein
MQEHGAPIAHRAPVAGRAIDIGGQAHAVPHDDRHVLGQVHVELGARRLDGAIESFHAGG